MMPKEPYFSLKYKDGSKKYGIQIDDKYILTQDRQVIDIQGNHLFCIRFTKENKLEINYIGNTETGFGFKAEQLLSDTLPVEFRDSILKAGAMFWLLSELYQDEVKNYEKIVFYGNVMNDMFAKAGYYGLRQPKKAKTQNDVWAVWKKQKQ